MDGSMIFLIVIAFFVLIFMLSSKRLKIEKGQKPIYTTRCGGRIGIISFSIPLGRITLYPDFLVIKGVGKFVIKYSQIQRIEKAGIFGGIEIVPKNTDKFGQPIISTFYNNTVRKIINNQMKTSANTVLPQWRAGRL